MWSLNLERLSPLVQGGLGKIAIETGTCRGNGTRLLAKNFSRVITIELSEALYLTASARLSGPEYSHVEFVRGNSAEQLTRILKSIAAPEAIFFFLDAHWSGDNSVNWTESEWKGYGLETAHLGKGPIPAGPEQCPLLGELEAITKHCSGPAIILIDDAKNIPLAGPGLKNKGFPGEDWSHLSREVILKVVEPRFNNLVNLTDPEQLLLQLKAI